MISVEPVFLTGILAFYYINHGRDIKICKFLCGRDGDMESFQSRCTREQNQLIEDLFKSEYKDMALFAYNTLGDANLAEAAVQDTFLIAMSSSISSGTEIIYIERTYPCMRPHLRRPHIWIHTRRSAWM